MFDRLINLPSVFMFQNEYAECITSCLEKKDTMQLFIHCTLWKLWNGIYQRLKLRLRFEKGLGGGETMK